MSAPSSDDDAVVAPDLPNIAEWDRLVPCRWRSRVARVVQCDQLKISVEAWRSRRATLAVGAIADARAGCVELGDGTNSELQRLTIGMLKQEHLVPYGQQWRLRISDDPFPRSACGSADAPPTGRSLTGTPAGSPRCRPPPANRAVRQHVEPLADCIHRITSAASSPRQRYGFMGQGLVKVPGRVFSLAGGRAAGVAAGVLGVAARFCRDLGYSL
jgi:hypothetical protein